MHLGNKALGVVDLVSADRFLVVSGKVGSRNNPTKLSLRGRSRFFCRRSRPAARSGRMPDCIIGAKPHNPAERQTVVELLLQQPFGADPEECLQQCEASSRWFVRTDGRPSRAYSLQKVGMGQSRA